MACFENGPPPEEEERGRPCLGRVYGAEAESTEISRSDRFVLKPAWPAVNGSGLNNRRRRDAHRTTPNPQVLVQTETLPRWVDGPIGP